MTDNVPKNLQAERAVIGSCLLSCESLGIVSEKLKAEDFYGQSNKMAYEICIEMYQSGKPVDLTTFQSEAISRGVFSRLGGQPYMAEVVGDAMAIANVEYYAELVHEASLRRRFVEAGPKITALGMKNDLTAEEIVIEAEKIVLEASAEKESGGPVSIGATMPSVLLKVEELRTGARKNTGYMLNFPDLDKILGGFQPGTLNIIAARPSMGKTALALNIAQFGSSAETNSHVLFFSLEMSSEQLIHRMLSAQTLEYGEGVEISSIAAGMLSNDDIYALGKSAEALQGRNVYINNSSNLSALEFRAKSLRFKTRHPDLSLIVVDYLQLMSSGSRRNENRQYEVAEISRVMKSTAVELDCPILALSQLSRETEKRVEKKPQLSDLRDSGAIEQDADTVIMLYREDYYGEKENNDVLDSKADIRVAKNRNGVTGMCNLLFRRKYTRFENYGGDI